MSYKIFSIFILIFIFSGIQCSHQHTDEADLHKHEEDLGTGHEHEKIQLIQYSDDFEIFAEADPFIVGQETGILAHFTHLTDFKSLDDAIITLQLKISDRIIEQTIEGHIRPGIYNFNITPEKSGIGQIIFTIKGKVNDFQIIIPNIQVFKDHNEFHNSETEPEQSITNTVVFTKEQSWKIDFATEMPKIEPFGQVILTTGQIQSAQGDEMVIPAKTNGIIKFSGDNVLEGKQVGTGQNLFSISGSGMADNNSSIRFSEARNNFEKAKTEYERHKELAADKIISQEKLIAFKTEYENSKAIYENLEKNFSASGQNVSSPMHGFVKEVFVKNGQYVEAGQPIASISQNKTLLILADVQQKYANELGFLKSANIRTLADNKLYSLEQLNGKVLSFGRNANQDNYLIPISLQIDNKGGFISGGFVELFLKTMSNSMALIIPNSAIIEEQGNYFVYVQINPELFEKRQIFTGVTDGAYTEVVRGILKNERIISKGAVLVKLSQASGALDPHAGHVH